jgi:hypothetical protein
MTAARLVAFPLILPWRQEFWTLPLYFPDLRVGVIPGWPAQLPYQGMALPLEAQTPAPGLKHVKPGDFLQWRAFEEYRQAQEGEGDLLRALRDYGRAEAPEKDVSPDLWALAWQLEKLQADQEAQLQLVDQGQEWLKEVLTPEPWEQPTGLGPVPGVPEMVDPDLAKIRYRLWQRVMGPQLQDPWVPFLLGRTARSLFLTLRGWPEQAEPAKVRLSLPGCRSPQEWLAVRGQGEAPPWQAPFQDWLAGLLDAAAARKDPEAAARGLAEFVADRVAASWPLPVIWEMELEVWLPESGKDNSRPPVLCWSGAGAADVLPG